MPVRVDEQLERSETRWASVGAYIFTLSTTLPGVRTELHSTYVAHPRTATQVTHLLLTPPDVPADSETVEHRRHVLPVLYQRRRCLFDHAHRLQELLEDLGHTAAIDVSAEAIASVEDLAGLAEHARSVVEH